MHLKRSYIFIVLLIAFSCFFSGFTLKAQQTSPVLQKISLADKKVFREQLIKDLIEKYQENQVFNHMDEYMIAKTEELYKHYPKKLPAALIQDTFDKTENLFEHTKSFIGNSFSASYEPEVFEKNVHRFLWLKGIGFFVMGIGDEHRLAFSYFYLPGNEVLKEDILKQIVQYSFPEIPENPANKVWYDEMVLVMGRLGYNIFSIKQFGL